jgi:hypothetical protein
MQDVSAMQIHPEAVISTAGIGRRGAIGIEAGGIDPFARVAVQIELDGNARPDALIAQTAPSHADRIHAGRCISSAAYTWFDLP